MSDLIRREDAIKAVSKVDDYGDGIGFEVRSHCLVELELVPSADRPQGVWTKTDVATYRCSECGKKQIADDVNELNYCCCCGSQNKVHYKVQILKGADDDI